MAVDLTPRQPVKAYGGDGGAYYEWSPAELPMLGVTFIGAAKLSLTAGGMSLPSYSDSAKVAYVLQVRYLRRTWCAIWGSKAAAHNSDLRLQMKAPRCTMLLPWKGFRVCAPPSGRNKEGASSTPRSWLNLEFDLEKQGIVWGHLSHVPCSCSLTPRSRMPSSLEHQDAMDGMGRRLQGRQDHLARRLLPDHQDQPLQGWPPQEGVGDSAQGR